jgi:hypothetical protein
MQILAIGGPYASAPVNAPTSLSGTPSTTSVSIAFTAPTNDGGSAITNYEYSFNNSTWTALSPADAITPVTVSGLTANTAYTIYLRAVNIVGSGPGSTGLSVTTNPIFMSASGGTTADYAEGGFTYRAHTFTGTSTFTVSTVGSFGTVDTLVIAGAGSGGGDRGSGGGAGGMYTWTGIGLAATSYTVVVGGGGAGVVNAFGNYGAQSYFANGTYATTGGGAGCGLYFNGGNGGSGGGSRNTGGTGVSGQGNAGGSAGGDLGAGGGGAGSAGTSSSGGAGGSGRASTYVNGASSTYSVGGARDVQATNYGGGGAGRSGGVTSGAGVQGLVVVRYRIA